MKEELLILSSGQYSGGPLINNGFAYLIFEA
jgi:hypothetical protein